MPLQCSKCKTRRWNKDGDIDVGGWVYLAQAIEPHANSLVKIGWSTQPHIRMTALRDPDGKKVKMIGAMPCDTQLGESRMHMMLKAYRVTGEWFALSAELIEKAKSVDLFEITKPSEPIQLRWQKPDGWLDIYDNYGRLCGYQPPDKSTKATWNLPDPAPIRETVIDTSYAQE